MVYKRNKKQGRIDSSMQYSNLAIFPYPFSPTLSAHIQLNTRKIKYVKLKIWFKFLQC